LTSFQTCTRFTRLIIIIGIDVFVVVVHKLTFCSDRSCFEFVSDILHVLGLTFYAKLAFSYSAHSVTSFSDFSFFFFLQTGLKFDCHDLFD
jgi:hypothetical protein